MPSIDKRIDAYLAKAQPFAQPILTELRKRMHKAVPDLEETIKWGMPFFTRDGKILATMSAFKAHARFGVVGAAKLKLERLTTMKDLPAAKAFDADVKTAAALLSQGKAAMRQKKPPRPVVVPTELAAALKKNAKARAAFEAFPPSHQREYCEWIAEAKRDETKAKRVATAVEWISTGKGRNWRYER